MNAADATGLAPNEGKVAVAARKDACAEVSRTDRTAAWHHRRGRRIRSSSHSRADSDHVDAYPACRK